MGPGVQRNARHLSVTEALLLFLPIRGSVSSAPDRGRANHTEIDMAKKTKDTGLYTDQRGRITCKEHAPIEGSDTWTMDRWKAMKASDATRFEKEVGRAPACETCAADAGWV